MNLSSTYKSATNMRNVYNSDFDLLNLTRVIFIHIDFRPLTNTLLVFNTCACFHDECCVCCTNSWHGSKITVLTSVTRIQTQITKHLYCYNDNWEPKGEMLKVALNFLVMWSENSKNFTKLEMRNKSDLLVIRIWPSQPCGFPNSINF